MLHAVAEQERAEKIRYGCKESLSPHLPMLDKRVEIVVSEGRVAITPPSAREYPDATIVFLCEGRFASFLTAHGIATDVVMYNRARMRGTPLDRGKELYRMVRTLRRFRFDLTIDLTDSKTSRIITRLVNARTRVGYDPPERPLRRLERLHGSAGIRQHYNAIASTLAVTRGVATASGAR